MSRWQSRSGRPPRKSWAQVGSNALQLHQAVCSTRALARRLAVPRSTLRGWLQRYAGVAQSAEATDLKSVQCGFESLHQHQYPAYAYLLGMYLGDGCISSVRRTYLLRILLHEKQGAIANRVIEAIQTLLPHNRVGRVRHHGAGIAVTCYSGAWPLLFPQHGRGRKHLRPIVLAPWQCQIVERHPAQFLRGCLESDGCRHRRMVAGRNYPAYSFTNHSTDILQLFAWAGQLLGVRPRRTNLVTMSIAWRADVARLDAIVEYEPSEDGLPTLREARVRYRVESNGIGPPGGTDRPLDRPPRGRGAGRGLRRAGPEPRVARAGGSLGRMPSTALS